MMATAWELGSDILESFVPGQGRLGSNGVTIERLKYDDCLDDLDRKFRLMSNARGTWAKIGGKIDAHKKAAFGLLARKYIGDIYGISCLLPGIGVISRILNRITGQQHRPVYPRSSVIGGAHTDARFFHALSSRRNAIKTEIHDGRGWRECPAAPNTLTIWPGSSIPRSAGIRPTHHRIVHVRTDGPPPREPMNISLILGAIPMDEGVRASERWPCGEDDEPAADITEQKVA